MSSRIEREERAFEALIVSQFCRECDPNKVNLEDLPALTAKERSALKELGPDLVERLWKDAKESSAPAPVQSRPVPTGELVMNRAEQVDAETAEELERRKAELIDRMRKHNEDKKNG